MKRFEFRLERLLQLRGLAEREQARQLAVALRAEEKCRQALREGEARLEEARAQYGGVPQELSQAGTLHNLELAVEALADEARRLSESHQQSLEQVSRERQGFEQARMARRVLERLREQRQQVWNGEFSRHEQSVSDETAIQRAQPGSREDL